MGNTRMKVKLPQSFGPYFKFTGTATAQAWRKSHLLLLLLAVAGTILWGAFGAFLVLAGDGLMSILLIGLGMVLLHLYLILCFLILVSSVSWQIRRYRDLGMPIGLAAIVPVWLVLAFGLYPISPGFTLVLGLPALASLIVQALGKTQSRTLLKGKRVNPLSC